MSKNWNQGSGIRDNRAIFLAPDSQSLAFKGENYEEKDG